MTSQEPTLTLQDVAHLAGVQRPVVSMWRRRPRARGKHIPFPAAVTAAGPERFRRDEVVDWLAATGRGKNVEHRLDAPTWSAPAGAPLEDLVTLLCLHAHGDSDLADLTAAERVSLAERADPDDEFMLTEVRHLADVAGGLPRFIDDLVEGSYGLPDALGRLEDGPAGRALGRRDLTAEAITLIHTVAQTVTLHLNPDGVPVAFAGDPPGLGLAVAFDARQLIVQGEGTAERALRRRALLHDIDVSGAASGPLTRVLSVLELEADSALDRVDDLLLELGPGEGAVVIGPAGTLCERLRGEAERVRATMLRPRRLVAALRLPRAMWRQAHRQALGLWVCVGGQTTDRPMVADLSAVQPDDLSMEDVGADVSGALAGGGGRGFRYLRAADLSLIFTGAPIVPQGVRAPRLRTSADDHMARLRTAAQVTAEPPPRFDVLATAAPGAVMLRQRSLGELQDKGLVAIRRGRRIKPGDAIPDGTVPVLSADGGTDGIALDPFDADELYPRAGRTEPGDVVFVERPSPRARVDEHGGALVACPSRILRLHRLAGVGPHTLAAIINHQSMTGEWRTWNVPILDPPAAATLEATLAGAAAYGAALKSRRDALHDLITALIDGVASGAVTVVPHTETQEGQVANATA